MDEDWYFRQRAGMLYWWQTRVRTAAEKKRRSDAAKKAWANPAIRAKRIAAMKKKEG